MPKQEREGNRGSAGGAPPSAEDRIDETLVESFPASDPPPWTTTHAGPPTEPSAESIADVLTFWFVDPARWWEKDPAFDAEIRARFLTLHGAIARGDREDWRETARGALAYVVVLDQFSRNMFRGSSRSFEYDALALAAARAALDRGFDRVLSDDERSFLCMPFMHSEAMADQDRCVLLFASGPPRNLSYAERHRDIIRRFGRFPHRNALLGRASTAEEEKFLEEPGSSF